MAGLKWVAAWLLVCMSVPAWAQTVGKSPWEEYDKLIEKGKTVATLGPDLFGDSADLDSGALSFSATDVSLPGNSGLPVAFTRKFAVKNSKGYWQRDLPLADWDLDVPRLSGVFASNWPDQRCSVSTIGAARPPQQQVADKIYLPEDYWQGHQASMPGGGEMMLVSASSPKPSAGGPYYWMTAGQTYFSCLSTIKNGTGEGFLAVASDGIKYWFDWMAQYIEPALDGKTSTGVATQLARRKNVLYATRVEDRFGNWVTYTYTNASNAPARLTAINANDGRQLTIGYNGNGHIASVSDGSRSWTYQYSYPTANEGTLTAVIQPDTSRWTIAFSALANASVGYSVSKDPGDYSRDCFNPGDPLDNNLPLTGTITHPSGAIGEFTVMIRRHGRSNVPAVCAEYTTPSNDPNDDAAYYPINWDAHSLTQKRISGPGLVTATWTYAYSTTVSWFLHPSGNGLPVCGLNAGCSPPQCTSDGCAGTSLTTITGPDNHWMRYTFGNSYRYNEGKLLKIEQGSSATDILKTTTTAYNLAQSGQPYAQPVGSSPQPRGDFTSEYPRPQTSRTIVQQGVTFSSIVDTGCLTAGVYCFDAFARATKATQSSSLGYTKTETTTYHDNPAKWVIGQIATQSTNGIQTTRTDYNAQALPWKTYAFGKPQQTLGYSADGTLATVADGRNNTTTLSNWKRGIPQSIQYPDATTQSAVVDGNGWIVSVTDEVGAKACYGYDSMGRIASITHPSETTTGVCDTSAWNATTQSFQQIGTPEYGIPAGHWRQSVSTGNARTNTYFDGLWRPLLTETYDQADVNNTLSRTVKRYDASGRLAFQSYPLRPLTDYASITQGSRNFYDALDRVTRVEQDSELGVLATTTEYLSGFETRVTNPRGFSTINGYQVYDQPQHDLLRWSVQPGDKIIEIFRHPQLGAPERILQRNGSGGLQQSRYYVYDGYRQLCKTIEPETGATVMDYDAAGNLLWSAAGLSLPNLGSCDNPSGFSSARKVTRSYDQRNRLATLMFPDGNGNQSWTYTADGLPNTITTSNDGGGSTVVNAYHYNSRRLLDGQGESLTQTGWYTWGIGYAHDRNGSLTGHRYHTGQYVDYAPNAIGQPTRAGSYATNVRYHPSGSIASFTYGNGVVHTMEQNARQLPAQTVSDGVSHYQYVYDGNANVQYIYDWGRGGEYHRYLYYDGLDRLTDAGSASFGGDHWHRFSYDALDNLKSWKLAGVKDYAYYDYDGNNRLTNIRDSAGASIVGLGYDVQGNLANKNGQGYAFDYGNRLRAVADKEYYRYDGHGRRTLSWSPTLGLIFSQYSFAGQLMYQIDDRKGKSIEHIYLGGSLVAQREVSLGTGAVAVRYQHTDALGSPVAVTNESGAVVERMSYEPYGKVIGGVPKDGPGYTGHVLDAATGLNYMQQRYYDPGIGRFLSVDPVTAYSNPIGAFNRYWYANNNPYRFTDPDGRQSVQEQIDSGAEGCGPVSCAGWAALSATWQVLGAEGISQIADKGWSGTGAGSRSSAGLEVAAVLPFVKAAKAGGLVIGRAQRTLFRGMPSGHAFRSLRVAAEMLKSGGYERIALNSRLSTLTDGAVNSRLRPDVAGLRPDGKIDITEVLSKGQKADVLQAKYAGALGDRMGNFKAVEATKVTCTGSRIKQTSC